MLCANKGGKQTSQKKYLRHLTPCIPKHKLRISAQFHWFWRRKGYCLLLNRMHFIPRCLAIKISCWLSATRWRRWIWTTKYQEIARSALYILFSIQPKIELTAPLKYFRFHYHLVTLWLTASIFKTLHYLGPAISMYNPEKSLLCFSIIMFIIPLRPSDTKDDIAFGQPWLRWWWWQQTIA